MISVLIATVNNFECLKETIETLNGNTINPIKIIIFDNGSTDENLLKYYDEHPELKVIRNKTNIGYIRAINKLFTEVETEYTLLLNDDVIVYPDSIDVMQRILEKNPDIGLIGPQSNWGFMGQKTEDNINYKIYGEETRKLIYISGFCFLFKTQLGKNLSLKGKLFDEIFGLGFYDDIDFCNRIHKSGKSVEVSLGSFIFHKSNVSFKKLKIDQNYILERNKKLYFQKWETPKVINLFEQKGTIKYSSEISEYLKKIDAEWINLLLPNKNFEKQTDFDYLTLTTNNEFGYYFPIYNSSGIIKGYKLGLVRNIEKYPCFNKIKRNEDFFIPEYNKLFFNVFG